MERMASLVFKDQSGQVALPATMVRSEERVLLGVLGALELQEPRVESGHKAPRGTTVLQVQQAA